ncbi:bifunctional sulfur transferase/dioxygenase Blh [Rhizobium sp. LEGMi135b]
MAIQVTDRIWIGPQLDLREFDELKRDGFDTIINLRRDNEDATQPGSQAEGEAARRAGLNYHFIPVGMDTIAVADVEAFATATTKSGGKVFAHCKSGIRAMLLHALALVGTGQMQAFELAAFGAKYGYDLSAGEAWLARHNAQRPQVKGFFDPRSSSVQYVVSDPATRCCAIIDPVLDFDEKSGATATTNADTILKYIEDSKLTVEWIFDTHPHADHFSAAHYLKSKTGAPMAIGEKVVDVQKLWKGIYNWPALPADGSQWDRLFAAGETFSIGSIEGKVMFSPGHTLASVTYVVGDAAFIHDTLFQPDSGTARADFPGGDAHMLWRSIQAILSLPDDVRLFTGHDYQPGGRAPRWESTAAEQKRLNAHVVDTDEEKFVALRTRRDRTLPMPKLILHALQVNVRGGRLPEPEDNGKRYLKIPLDALDGATW